MLKNLPKIFTIFVFISNSVATKKGNKEGTTELAQSNNPFLTAGRFVFENNNKQKQNIKKHSAKKFLLIFMI